MRTRLLIGLIVTLCFLGGVGSASADSFLTFPDGTQTEAIDIGSGIAFVSIDNPGDGDIFIHPVNFSANLLFVTLNNTFSGFAIWLDFEGFNGGFRQYGVFVCTGAQTSCSFGSRRGTFFL
jgi:hypothetical protein